MAVADTSVAEEKDQGPRPDEERELRWRMVRRRAAVAYFVILVAFSIVVGIPEDREGLLAWILAGLGVSCLGRGWRSYRRVLLDWLPFTAVLVAYDYTRGLADNLGIATHVKAPASADLWLCHGTLPTYWLQQHLYIPGDPRWYDAVVIIVYTSHFLATPVAAVILWLRDRQLWLSFIGRVIALSVAGLGTYILYPAAPPWYASEHGVIPPVIRLASRGWLELHLNHAGNLLQSAQASVNAVAAMPSLHTATATMITLFFLPRVPRWAKVPLACYPLLMGFVLVYSAEHYLVDLLFGYVYGIVITVSYVQVERRRARRKAAMADSAAPELVPSG